MGIFNFFKNKIHQYIIKKATQEKLVDIVEVRTKTLSLTYVNLETDIKIINTFWLPIEILEINTDIVNTSELKVGMMVYKNRTKIKGNSELIFTTQSKMSNITAFFNLLSRLLTLTITIRSVGTAKIKVLWFVVNVPIDDTFEIMPNQLKIIEELTEEEKLKLEEEKKIRRQKKEQKKQERMAHPKRKQQDKNIEIIQDEDEHLKIELDKDALKNLDTE